MGQSKLSVFTGQDHWLCQSLYHLSAVITDGSSIKEFLFIISLGGEGLRLMERSEAKTRMEAFARIKDAGYQMQMRNWLKQGLSVQCTEPEKRPSGLHL